ALQAERFNFQSLEGQTMLKEAASRGQAETVHELVAAGVPLDSLPAPKLNKQEVRAPSDSVGLLASASRNLQTLQILLDSGVSRNNQSDKEGACVECVRLLAQAGASVNARDKRRQYAAS